MHVGGAGRLCMSVSGGVVYVYSCRHVCVEVVSVCVRGDECGCGCVSVCVCVCVCVFVSLSLWCVFLHCFV